ENGSATADEVDDFVAVVGLDLRCGPLIAGQDIEIAFNGDAAMVEAKVLQQIDDRRPRLNGARFAVDGNRLSCAGCGHVCVVDLFSHTAHYVAGTLGLARSWKRSWPRASPEVASITKAASSAVRRGMSNWIWALPSVLVVVWTSVRSAAPST